jgi:hypothetical protein
MLWSCGVENNRRITRLGAFSDGAHGLPKHGIGGVVSIAIRGVVINKHHG